MKEIEYGTKIENGTTCLMKDPGKEISTVRLAQIFVGVTRLFHVAQKNPIS